jgi:hypothetical protein
MKGHRRRTQELRRLDLLSYVEALMYHVREPIEHNQLRQRIDAALYDDEARLEVEMVRKTIAEAEGEKYTLAADKRTLLDLLRIRWGKLPPEIEQTVDATQDIERLHKWLRRVVKVEDLASVGILTQK